LHGLGDAADESGRIDARQVLCLRSMCAPAASGTGPLRAGRQM
jgi:hypothetical protein